MKKHLGDWSLNLEDEEYANNSEGMLREAVEAVKETNEGNYVNVVLHETTGDPQEGFSDLLAARLKEQGVSFRGFDYRGQCGCGGHVLRVNR